MILSKINVQPVIRALICILLLTSNVLTQQKTILTAYDQQPQFDKISIEHGLSQGSVQTIVQDKYGFMWFGTEDGLNRYDGYTFKVYKNIRGDQTTICNNAILALCVDEDGDIWIGTDGGGVCRLNPTTEQFVHYLADAEDSNSLRNNAVFSLLCDKNNNIWMGTWGGGVSVFSPGKEKYLSISMPPENKRMVDSSKVWFTYDDSRGNVWISSDMMGVVRFPVDSLEVASGRVFFKADTLDTKSISENMVTSICEDANGAIWLGTYSNGLNRYDYETDAFIRYSHNAETEGTINENSIWKIFEDSRGTLWIATMSSGINIYKREKDTFSSVQNIATDFTSLSSNNIRSIYEDRSGVLWIGSMAVGINKVNPAARKFMHVKNETRRKDTLSNDFVFAICESRTGDIWVGTYGGGLNRYNPARNSFKVYRNDPENSESLPSDVVRCLLEDSRGRLWIGTYYGGFCRYEPSKDAFKRFDNPTTHEGGLNIRDIFEDANGTIWIGTNGSGLFEFDEKNNRFKYYNTDDVNSEYVLTIAQDTSGAIWTGSYGGGLNRFDPDSGTVKQFKNIPASINSLSHNVVPEIYFDSQQRFWVGTFGGGLNLYDPISGQFTNFDESDGLGGNIITGILEDKQGLLWIGVNNSITSFDPDKQVFQRYDFSDGLQLGDTNPGASFLGGTGIMYFGGVNGFNAFRPEAILENPVSPPVAITSFKIFEQPVSYDRAIHVMDTLNLSYLDRFFSFEFSALDYTNSAKNQYRYKMNGFNEKWVDAGTRRYVSYTNLDPGNYTFMVRGSNNDGVWSENVATVDILIVPPFWQTSWFISAMGLIILSIAGLLYHARISGLKKEKRVREDFSRKLIDTQEKERKRIASELHDSIGQELLIITTEIKHIEKEKRSISGNKLSSLVLNTLEQVREMSSNLHPHLVDRLGLKNAVESLTRKVSTISGLTFKLNMEDLHKLGSKEQEVHVYRIVQESLNNIMKHANASTVHIDLACGDAFATLSIADDGRGFKFNADSSGFGLQSIQERCKIINGTMAVESTPGTGTSIIMKFPNGTST